MQTLDEEVLVVAHDQPSSIVHAVHPPDEPVPVSHRSGCTTRPSPQMANDENEKEKRRIQFPTIELATIGKEKGEKNGENPIQIDSMQSSLMTYRNSTSVERRSGR